MGSSSWMAYSFSLWTLKNEARKVRAPMPLRAVRTAWPVMSPAGRWRAAIAAPASAPAPVPPSAPAIAKPCGNKVTLHDHWCRLDDGLLVNHRSTAVKGLRASVNHLVLCVSNCRAGHSAYRTAYRRAFQRSAALISNDRAGQSARTRPQNSTHTLIRARVAVGSHAGYHCGGKQQARGQHQQRSE